MALVSLSQAGPFQRYWRPRFALHNDDEKRLTITTKQAKMAHHIKSAPTHDCELHKLQWSHWHEKAKLGVQHIVESTCAQLLLLNSDSWRRMLRQTLATCTSFSCCGNQIDGRGPPSCFHVNSTQMNRRRTETLQHMTSLPVAHELSVLTRFLVFFFFFFFFSFSSRHPCIIHNHNNTIRP